MGLREQKKLKTSFDLCLDENDDKDGIDGHVHDFRYPTVEGFRFLLDEKKKNPQD